MVIIVFIAGLTGYYVFATILVGLLSTFGVLKKTTNVETKKARKKPPDEDKVPVEETTKVSIENEMTLANREDAEDAKVQINLVQ